MWKNIVQEWIRIEFDQKKYNVKFIQKISGNPFLPLDLVLHYPHFKWDWLSLSKHPEMTLTFCKRLKKKTNHRIQRIFLSNTTTEINWEGKKTFDFVTWEKKGLPHTYRLSHHPLLPLILVVQYPQKSWNFHFLYKYRLWNIRWLKDLSTKRRIDWHVLSRNVQLREEIILEFLGKPWDWNYLAKHPNLNPEWIYNNPILFPRWKWKKVFLHPRITVSFWKMIHEGRIHDPYILENHFQYSKELQLWAHFKINHSIIHWKQRNNYQEKIRFLIYLRNYFPSCVLSYIITFL